MRTRLAIKLHGLLEHFFPERRLFLRSETDTRFIRLKSSTQAIAFGGAAVVIAWSIVATAVLLIFSRAVAIAACSTSYNFVATFLDRQ